jgi:hypothetical protein
MDQSNYPPEFHIDAGSKQGGRDERQHALDNIRSDGPVGRLLGANCSTNVSNSFN